MRAIRSLRHAARLFLRKRGIRVLRVSDPLIRSLDRIPPLASHFESGGPDTYYVCRQYQPRTGIAYFDDTRGYDDYQKEVYEVARLFADGEGCGSVCDVGCGSGYKLLKNFGDYESVIGVDLPRTVSWLKAQYPGRTWISEDLSQPSSIRADLVVASDVIEHVADPNQLLDYIESMQPRVVVLSTPDRNLLLNGRHFGPPGNPAHVREWGFLEFHCYIRERFEIAHHFIVNPFQATQMVIARCRLHAG